MQATIISLEVGKPARRRKQRKEQHPGAGRHLNQAQGKGLRQCLVREVGEDGAKMWTELRGRVIGIETIRALGCLSGEAPATFLY